MLDNPTVFPRRLRQRLPFRWRQQRDMVLVGHGGQPREHVFDVDERIDAVSLAGNHNRINDRRALAGVRVADEQPVLFFMYRDT